MSRVIGLDVGDRRIGVALSDPEGILASPFAILERTDDAKDVKTIVDIVSGQQAGRIIVGMPRSLSGSLGEQAEKVKKFAETLTKTVGVPVEYRDERLSTVSAEKMLRESRTKPRSRRDKQQRHRDDIAAAIILQGYLDEVRDRDPRQN